MPSPKTIDALLAPKAQKTLTLPVAALILGAVSQVDSLIELADRVCDTEFRQRTRTTANGGGHPVARNQSSTYLS
jgi:hypothetical protein